MFKLALSAGHYYYTAGRRCSKEFDANETREWTLNDRVCDAIAELLRPYDDIEILRVDDPMGEVSISLSERARKANEWGADLYLAVHHNGGINGGAGGGICVFVERIPDADELDWQVKFYEELIANTGLIGNRYSPMTRANFDELVLPKCSAVLLELGFMDSSTDVPIIITPEFSEGCAKAIADTIIIKAGLKVKADEYYVMCGPYSSLSKAKNVLTRLGNEGFGEVKILRKE